MVFPWEGRNIDRRQALGSCGSAAIRLEAIPIYVEYEDGSRFEPEGDHIFQELSANRQALLDEYHAALSAYNKSGKEGLLAELGKAKGAFKQNRGRGLAANVLFGELQRKGLGPVVSDLLRVKDLQIPK